jgi:CheY-like chemotaxis protein
MKVLLADDDKITTTLLSATIVREGWQAIVVHDAMQALMYASKMVPDAIVLDINMPGGNGYHVLERLRASTRTRDIPVIVITGSNDPNAEYRALRFGAAAFLTKPLDLPELVRLISALTSASASVTLSASAGVPAGAAIAG